MVLGNCKIAAPVYRLNVPDQALLDSSFSSNNVAQLWWTNAQGSMQ